MRSDVRFGSKADLDTQVSMSALPPKADIARSPRQCEEKAVREIDAERLGAAGRARASGVSCAFGGARGAHRARQT